MQSSHSAFRAASGDNANSSSSALLVASQTGKCQLLVRVIASLRAGKHDSDSNCSSDLQG